MRDNNANVSVFRKSATVGFISFWLLPNGVASAKFLKPEEREFAIQRLRARAGNSGREQSVKQISLLLRRQIG